jgi:transposase
MSKYSKQFKLKVVKEFLKSGGLKRVGHLFEISHSDVRKWTLAYQAHGHSGLNPSHQRHSPQFKVQVLQYMAQHQISARPATAHFGIGSMTTILQWQRLYNEGGITALEPKPKGRPSMSKPFKPLVPTNKPVTQMTPEELMQELEYRRVETDYLKKLEALAQSKAVKENKSK